VPAVVIMPVMVLLAEEGMPPPTAVEGIELVLKSEMLCDIKLPMIVSEADVVMTLQDVGMASVMRVVALPLQVEVEVDDEGPIS
jgi:hypothetical protein